MARVKMPIPVGVDKIKIYGINIFKIYPLLQKWERGNTLW